MKRGVFILIFTFLLVMPSIKAVSDREQVVFSDCVDGDTIKVIIDNEEKTVRFLAVDTPETKHPTKGQEPYGKTASNYTCDKVKNAKTLELEYDPGSDKEDKYDRLLAWIYTDGSLLQKELIENGYAKVEYIYGDYLYTDDLYELEETAKNEKLGIWSSEEEFTWWEKIINAIIEFLESLFEELIIKPINKAIKAIFG